jgi:hypothetical protein
VNLDVVITREPGINLPRLAGVESADRSGIERIADFSVISELKVASTQAGVLDYSDVCRDFLKLSMLLVAAARRELRPLPHAYVCVLANHSKRPFNWGYLAQATARLRLPDR